MPKFYTNNLHTVIWFQILIFYTLSSYYSYLKIVMIILIIAQMKEEIYYSLTRRRKDAAKDPEAQERYFT